MKLFFERIRRFEFWPVWLFYIPLLPYVLYLSLRAGSPVFFSAANPGFLMGGFVGMSKFDALAQISERYRPAGVRLEPKHAINERLQQVEDFLGEHALGYPVIAKPDIGMRSKDVEKIDSAFELRAYLHSAEDAVIVQEYIDAPLEFSVFYIRFPHEEKGRITSVTQKELLHVTGDGVSSLKTLIKQSDRAKFYTGYFFKKHKQQLDRILSDGERLRLDIIGNHWRGTTFYNRSELISKNLTEVFDSISKQIDGFYYGRYDFKLDDLAGLKTGKGIHIVEINGANAEPIHIYSPHYPLLKGYKDLFQHWYWLYQISRENHKNGAAYMLLSDAIKYMWLHI